MLSLYEWLSARGNVYLLSDSLTMEQVYKLKPTCVVSYNYIHTIQDDVIEYMNVRITVNVITLELCIAC